MSGWIDADDHARKDPPGTSEKQELEPAPAMLTIPQVATRLGISTKTARRMIQRGELPGAFRARNTSKNTDQWLVPVASVDSLELSRQDKPQNTTASQLTALREQIRELETQLIIERTISQNNAHQLEQLHQTVRLMISATPSPAPRTAHWWNRKK